MNRAVGERRGERGIHSAVLVEKGETVEVGARDRHLEVVARTCAILDVELGGVRKRLLEERTDRLSFHPGPC